MTRSMTGFARCERRHAAGALTWELRAVNHRYCEIVLRLPEVEYRKLTTHFMLWLVTSRSINPLTGGNWQGTGVQPDIAVSEEKALETAGSLARRALGR